MILFLLVDACRALPLCSVESDYLLSGHLGTLFTFMVLFLAYSAEKKVAAFLDLSCCAFVSSAFVWIDSFIELMFLGDGFSLTDSTHNGFPLSYALLCFPPVANTVGLAVRFPALSAFYWTSHLMTAAYSAFRTRIGLNIAGLHKVFGHCVRHRNDLFQKHVGPNVTCGLSNSPDIRGVVTGQFLPRGTWALARRH